MMKWKCLSSKWVLSSFQRLKISFHPPTWVFFQRHGTSLTSHWCVAMPRLRSGDPVIMDPRDAMEATRDPWGDETSEWTGTDNISHFFCPVLSSSGVEISEMNDEFRMELEPSQGWSCTNWVWLKCWGGCLVGNELSSQCWICLCGKCHRLAPSELKRLGKLC